MIGFFISALYLLTCLNLHIQDEPSDKQIINKLTDFSWNHPQEKVYIHTDKPFYAPGEDVWFKAYLMLGPYQIPDTICAVLYVELIHHDGTIIDRKILHMLEGLGWSDFDLPATIDPGKYILKAYTSYMQNYDPAFQFRKVINIIPVHPGYYRAREFYYPNYDVPDERHIKPDYRRVLYWNPSLTTDDFGDISFSFYTSDETAEYRVEIEGMTYSGIPLTYEYYFSVE